MKKQVLTWALLTVGFGLYAQKEELKEIKKAVSKKDYTGAMAAIGKHSSVFANAEPKLKETYVLLKAQVLVDLVKKDSTNLDLMTSAVEALNDVKSSKANDLKETLLRYVQLKAQKDYEGNNMKEAATGYENLYRLRPQDTIYLYSAASIAARDPKHYDTALRIYDELVKMNYDGASTRYLATNIQTGKEEEFDKKTRDTYVALKTHKDPKDLPEPSKKPEIVKNIAVIYTQQGRSKEALDAFKVAREKNPDDVNLIIAEANILYETGDKERFKELIQLAISKEPKNPDLYYNIGVANSALRMYDEAIEAYKKTLEIDPKYVNASINLSGAYIEKGNAFIEKMNEIAKKTRRNMEEEKQYEAFKTDKENNYKEAAKVVEEAVKTNPTNRDLLTRLKNIYGALSDTVNYKRIKALLGE